MKNLIFTENPYHFLHKASKSITQKKINCSWKNWIICISLSFHLNLQVQCSHFISLQIMLMAWNVFLCHQDNFVKYSFFVVVFCSLARSVVVSNQHSQWKSTISYYNNYNSVDSTCKVTFMFNSRSKPLHYQFTIQKLWTCHLLWRRGHTRTYLAYKSWSGCYDNNEELM